jgi:hypothetical protein
MIGKPTGNDKQYLKGKIMIYTSFSMYMKRSEKIMCIVSQWGCGGDMHWVGPGCTGRSVCDINFGLV